MFNLKNIAIMMLILMLSTVLASCVFAADEENYGDIKYEFNVSNLTFSYNDHNTSTYEGDTGLDAAYCKNTIDNKTYRIPVAEVRGLAYASKGTFKFNETIEITHSLSYRDSRDYDYIVLFMYYKNGTEIPTLDISDDDLTLEQRNYFDNYAQEKQDYYQRQQELDMQSLGDDSLYRSSSSNNNHNSHFGYYVGTRRSGIVYYP